MYEFLHSQGQNLTSDVLRAYVSFGSKSDIAG